MKEFSTILLINILRANVEHLQESRKIDPARPGVKELKRTLLEQIVRLQASEPGSRRFIVKEALQARNGL